jgi:hypothetical protein
MSGPNVTAVAEKVFGPSEDKRPAGWGGDNPEKWDYTLEMANYVERLRDYENEARTGRDKFTGDWTPHDSPEGGTKTVGYGHKLSDTDDPDRQYTDAEVEKMFMSDLFNAYRTSYNKYSNRGHDWEQLSNEDKIILTELQFNTGGGGEDSLMEQSMKALSGKDYHELEAIVNKRGYKDENDNFTPLTTRNEGIIDTYISPYK